MHTFLRIAKREIALLFHNKSLFTFAVILPFIIFLFFFTLLSNGVARDLPIAVVDLDNSSFSRTIIAQLNATPEVEVAFIPESTLEAESLIKNLDVYGFVVIPNNANLNLKQGKQITISNQYNSNLLLPSGLVNKAFQRVIGTLSAKVNIEKQLKKGIYLKQAKTNYQAVQLNNSILSNPYLNYNYYLNSGFLTFFFQIFVLLTTIYAFGTDLKYNKGDKLFNIAKGNTKALLLGKRLPYTLWFFTLGLILLIAMFSVVDFPFAGNKILVIVSLLLLIIASQTFALLFISLSKSFREALTFGSGFTAVSLSFSGITFPVFGMPNLLQLISNLFPFTHFFNLFLDQTQRGLPMHYSQYPVFFLIGLITLSIVISYKKIENLLIKGSFTNNI
ncbi:MAG TPA: ABC transporter permease [Flavobacteriaceae bacterium]|nr:ABC transporter permease [Flavobacteriaceae bacterium]